MAQSLTNKLKGFIQAQQPEIYINLINCGNSGKKLIQMLEAAGYEPDNLGPQRVYKKK